MNRVPTATSVPTMSVPTMSAAVARRTALAAQGFADPRPAGTPTRRHLAKVLSRVQLFQLDSVNVAVRAHYMPLFSRLGAYPMELVDDAAWSHHVRRPRLLTEYWAHEASLIPIADWPLLRWRMRHFAQPGIRYFQQARTDTALLSDVLATVKELGPLGAGAVERELGLTAQRAGGGWWNRSTVKRACEYLFAVGELSTGARRGFERLYDLAERVLPTEVHAARIDDDEAARALTERAARAFGVATEPDLRDYYRMTPAASQRAVAELVDAGVLERVAVRGWSAPAYRHVEARTPRTIAARALLCPFDPVIWRRERAERLFDFAYRIEIYVPEHQRVHGYYVFPFLLDSQLVARVDLKADRAAGVLRVQGAFGEPDTNTGRVAAELAEELRSMAEWLGLSGVQIGQRGDLAGALGRFFR